MQLKIYRGAQEIGGTCLEIFSGNTRILLDVGLPLFDAQQQLLDTRGLKSQSTEELLQSGIIPAVAGLTAGDSAPDAILLSHAHLDHCGLLDRTSTEIPIYATSGTSKMMLAGSLFAGQSAIPRPRHRKLVSEQPVRIGEFQVTPFAVDHSIFGAVALLIEADGKSLLYSGDLRLHGRKTGMAHKLVKACQEKELDVLVMEGTHVGQPAAERMTEYDLEEHLVEQVKLAPGLVLASFSPQHVDRLVAFIRASMRTGRTFVADAYTAFVLHLVSGETHVPVPGKAPGMPVYFPATLQENKRKLRLLRQSCPFLEEARIALKEILAHPSQYVMMFRESMLQPDFGGTLPEGVLCVHSRWEGYLDEPPAEQLKQQIQAAGGQLVQLHTSGHIYVEDLLDLVQSLNPKKVVPVHTFAPEEFVKQINNVQLLPDGEVLQID